MRRRAVLVGTVSAAAILIALTRQVGLSESGILVLSNVVMVVVALVASGACAHAARRAAGRRRSMWTWLAVATGGWTVGQAIWSHHVTTQGSQAPLPWVGDVAFLSFPVAASVAMTIWLGSHGRDIAARGRDLLDGAIIAGSLLVLSWVTVLDAVAREHDAAGPGLTLVLAYPVGDVILGTLVLLALVRGAPHERFTLGVLAAGLGGLAFSDSAYVYFTSQGAEWYGDIFGLGYFFGFLLVTVAAATDHVPADADRPDAVRTTATSPADLTTWSLVRLALPYVPLVAAMAALGTSVAGTVTAPPTTDLLLGVALVLIVLTRQFLAMVENLRLVLVVQEGRDKLEHLALHDALTGLPNRVLFTDRLDRALLDPWASVSVLFCDLDDFKQINDLHGHEAGDVLLATVAERLTACVRATDTVARFGGDEFAIVLVDSPDPVEVAERVVSSLRQPIVVDGASLRTSVSIGIARRRRQPVPLDDRRGLSPDPWSTAPRPTVPPETAARSLLRTADKAMYEAKRAGKGRSVVLHADAQSPVLTR